jgi:hypothetical protein
MGKMEAFVNGKVLTLLLTRIIYGME